MADNSLKLRALIGGVPIERDPIPLMAGVLPQVPIIVGDGGSKTVGEAFSDSMQRNRNLGDLIDKSQARQNLNLERVSNTSDAEKPISIAQKAAIDARLAADSNLQDLTDKGASRFNLGLADLATKTETGVTQAIVAPGLTPLTNRLKSDGWISTNGYGGIANDGTTDCTVMLGRAAADIISDLGAELRVSPGNYRTGQQVINRAKGGKLIGNRRSVLRPTASGTVLFDLVGANPGPDMVPFTLDGVEVDATGFSNVSLVREYDAQWTTLRNLVLRNLAYNCVFFRGRGITVKNIKQFGSGSWFFTGGNSTGISFEIDISNIDHQSLGGSSWIAPWFQFYRTVGVYMNNVITSSLDGATRGVELTGGSEGFFANNVIMVWPTTGWHFDQGIDGALPAYIYLTNTACDQPTISGYDIRARTFRAKHLNSTFGTTRMNSGSGVIVRAPSERITIDDPYFEQMYKDGLWIEPGCGGVLVNNPQFLRCGESGSGVDLRIPSALPKNVRIKNSNHTTSVVGSQYIDNGSTTGALNRSAGSVDSLEGSADTVLKSYTITQGFLSGGERVKFLAKGNVQGAGTSGTSAKTLSLRVAGIQLLSLLYTQANAGGWTFEGEIMRFSAGASFVSGKFTASNQLPVEYSDFAISAGFQPDNGTIVFELHASGAAGDPAGAVRMLFFEAEMVNF